VAQLPEPQRHAVEVALLRAEPEGTEPLQRAVAVGTLGVLAALARERPTLVAIDDVQWLDGASGSALGFALRRLTDERVGVLVVRRSEGSEADAAVPLDLDRALPEGRLHHVRPGSLSVAALDRMLHRAAGGNPFVALEIGRALLDRGDVCGPIDDLPIPARLQALVRDRLAQLPAPALQVARVAAALSRPTTALVGAAMAGDGDGAAVEAAVRAGVVERDGDHLRFTHPLFASVTYAQVPAGERHALHRRLAGLVDDPEERARATWRSRRRRPTPGSRPRWTRRPAGRGRAARRTRRPSCPSWRGG